MSVSSLVPCSRLPPSDQTGQTSPYLLLAFSSVLSSFTPLQSSPEITPSINHWCKDPYRKLRCKETQPETPGLRKEHMPIASIPPRFPETMIASDRAQG